MEQLRELSGRSPVVRCALEMAEHEPLTDAERGRLAFRTLLELRHSLLRQLLARGAAWALSQVAWPAREPEMQAQVLAALDEECARMSVALEPLVQRSRAVA